MLGISLPIATTAVMLIGQIATDAPAPAFLGDVRQVNALCSQPSQRYPYGRSVHFKSAVGADGIAVAESDPTRRAKDETIRINLKSMAYVVTQKKLRRDDESVTEIGVCRELP